MEEVYLPPPSPPPLSQTHLRLLVFVHGANCSSPHPGPLSSASHQPEGSGREWGWAGAALGWVRAGGWGRGFNARCMSGVGHATLDTSCFCLPPTPPCLTSFINVPNCEASARSGGLWWLVYFHGPRWKHCSPWSPVSLTTQGLQASSALLRHTESQERGCTTFIVSQHLWFPSLPTPSQGKGMRLPSCPRAPAWPGSVLLATCGGMTASGAGETVGTTILSPGRAWAPTQQELGPHPLNHPF